MDERQSFLKDDDDDTSLFEKLQEHVLEKYPNPERIGCIDHTTLKAWVYTPEKLDLSDPKYLHVLKCAECTRELLELREQRNKQRGQVGVPEGALGMKRIAGLAIVGNRRGSARLSSPGRDTYWSVHSPTLRSQMVPTTPIWRRLLI